MGLAERLVDFFRCAPPRKKKPQIARALRPGSDGVVQPGGDRQFGDSWNRTSGIFSGDAFQYPASRDGNHHDAGGKLFAWRIPSGEFQRVANKQLFEPDWLTCTLKVKSQGSGAETADRPRRNFQWPHPILVDSKLRVDWSVRKAQRSYCISSAFLDGALHGFGKPRRCDVNRLFEVWTFERIGLIEDRQNALSTIGKKSFDRDFPPRYVIFHEHLLEIRLTSGKNLRGFEQATNTCSRREKLLTIVRAHYTLTRRKRKRF